KTPSERPGPERQSTIMCPSTAGNKPRRGRRPQAGLRRRRLLQSIGTSARANLARRAAAKIERRSDTMKNPLDSLWGTIISGLVLTVILYFVVKSILLG